MLNNTASESHSVERICTRAEKFSVPFLVYIMMDSNIFSYKGWWVTPLFPFFSLFKNVALVTSKAMVKPVNVYCNSPCVRWSLLCHYGIHTCMQNMSAGQKIKLLCENFVSFFSKHLLFLWETSEGFPIGHNFLNHSFDFGRSCKNTHPQWRVGRAV
jgi:hypothetical protein